MSAPIAANAFMAKICSGAVVTILAPAGRGRNGLEYAPRTGRAVMRSSHGGWVLNMGGQHGTPGIATAENVVSVILGKTEESLSTEEVHEFREKWRLACDNEFGAKIGEILGYAK